MGNAIWNLRVLTSEGELINKFADAWKQIEKLPAGYKLFTAEKWVENAENVVLDSVSDEIKNAFITSLNEVKDILTMGKADAAYLSDLLTKANQMNYFDFTAESWENFGIAKNNANKVANDYNNVTQSTVDTAAKELYTAWSSLKMYVARSGLTLWIISLKLS